jgi:hypothetical protein
MPTEFLTIKPTRCTNFSRIRMFHPDPARKPVWHIPLLCGQWKTPDDGQRNCPKHVEFHSKNYFEKLVHLVGFNIRIRTVILSSFLHACHTTTLRISQSPAITGFRRLTLPISKHPAIHFPYQVLLLSTSHIKPSCYPLPISSPPAIHLSLTLLHCSSTKCIKLSYPICLETGDSPTRWSLIQMTTE